jgi:hypothetical protein
MCGGNRCAQQQHFVSMAAGACTRVMAAPRPMPTLRQVPFKVSSQADCGPCRRHGRTAAPCIGEFLLTTNSDIRRPGGQWPLMLIRWSRRRVRDCRSENHRVGIPGRSTIPARSVDHILARDRSTGHRTSAGSPGTAAYPDLISVVAARGVLPANGHSPVCQTLDDLDMCMMNLLRS